MKKIISIALLNIVLTYSLFAQQSKIDSLLSVLSHAKQDTDKVNQMNDLCWEQASVGNYDTAHFFGQGALKLAQKINFKNGIAQAYNNIGNVYFNQGNYPEALKNNFSSLKIKEEIIDKKGMAFSFNNIANVYNIQGKYSEALKNYSEALKVLEELKNKKGVASVSSNIGVIYFNKGNFPEAMKYFLLGLKTREELGDKYGIASSLMNVGGIYESQAKYPEALKNYSRSLKLYEEIEDKKSIAMAQYSIGNIYFYQRNYNDALKQYLHALKIREAIGDKHGLGMVYNNIGEIYAELGEYDAALKNQLLSLTIKEEIGDKQGIAMSCVNIGKIYSRQKKFADAKEYLKRGLQVAKELGEKQVLKTTYETLTELAESQNDFKKAMEYYREFSKVKDSLLNENNNKQIADMKTKYETDKKDNEILLLNKDNELQNEKIKQQAKNNFMIAGISMILLLTAGGFGYYRNKRNKENALKEIGEAKLSSLKSLMDKHFISGSLNSIDAFLMNHDAESASNYLVKYSKLIRNILHFSTKPEVTLEEEIELCKSYLYLEKIHYDNCFDYSFEIDNKISISETLFPSMLLQPLIENAVKHGIGSQIEDKNSVKGFIKITLTKENDKLVCRVIDNGKGLGFSSGIASEHQSYSGKGITERVRVYNSLRKNKASFTLSENNPGVTSELIVPYMVVKQTQKMTA